MKKALTLLLVFLLSLSVFVACDFGQKPEQEQQQGGENNPPVVDEDLQAAYDYIKLTYKTLGTTATNFEVMKNAPVGEKMFAITWTTNNEAITITETEDGKFYVVNVPLLGEASIAYTLNFSIQNDKGEKKEGSFNLTVPAYQVNTFDEYAAAEDGTSLTVQGIVTGVISKSTNSTKENSLFLQDLNNNGGYYIYNLAEDPAGTISVGMTVEVKGEKKNYNGTFELVNPVVTVIDQTIKTVTPVDYTDIFAAAASTDAAELIAKQGMLVSINGVTLLNYTESDGYHNFELGNNKSYLRVSSSSNCITKAEGKTVTETFIANFYNSATVTGIIAVFNGGFYLMPVSSAPFTGFVEQEKPTDVKINIALENTKIPSIIQVAGDTALPTTFSSFSDVSIAWELVVGETAGCATLNGSTLSVTIPEAAETITLKATATCGNVSSEPKEYTVTVKGIDTITIEEANNIGNNMAHNTYTEELYYIVGTVDSVANTQYGNLYIVDGDFSIYVYGTYDSTGNVRYDAMDPQPLKKDTIKVLSTIGKYNNDVQLKNAKVVEHTVHEDNKVEVKPGVEVEFKPVNPIVDTQYYFAMVQDGKVCYITGLMATGNSKYYMATTNSPAVAAIITVTAGTDGTYFITLTVDGATKYMDLVDTGSHKNAVYVDEKPEVGFSFDAETKVFYKVLAGDNYTFGTDFARKFTTIGAVKIDAELNAMCQISFVEAHTCTFTDVTTAPTCEADGYTTRTCACGNVVVVTDEGSALNHNFGENNDALDCINDGCDVKNPDIHTCEFVFDKTVAPTCTSVGYDIYKCADETCLETENRNEQPALSHEDTDGDYKCDNGTCDELVLPAADSTLTIEQALAIGALTATTQKYYVTGTITEFYTNGTTYGNFYIKDAEGKSILVYGLYKGGVRYDAMTVKPVIGDTITVYGTINPYKGVGQFGDKNNLNELISHTAHEHDYEDVVTDPTCTAAGYTTHTCSICKDSYKDTEVGALGHTTENGTCERCDNEIGGATEETKTVTTADFNTVGNNTSYSDRTTTSGWTATNCAVYTYGTGNTSGKFAAIPDGESAFTINGKVGSTGTITSPTLSGGVSKISFNYANFNSESNGVDITITVKQNGVAVASKQLDNNSVTKFEAYEFVWDLAIEETVVSGNFTIEITNNSPSNNSKNNKDRVSIWNLQITSAPATEA